MKVFTLCDLRRANLLPASMAFISVADLPRPAIRFLVDTVSSARDINGNRYHWARITSTVTGRSLAILETSATNPETYANRACALLGVDSWPAVHSSHTEDVPKREWAHGRPADGVYDHLVTPQMIVDLEQPSNET